MQEVVNLAGVTPNSTVDGPGIRFTVFFQGCPHKCEGCHNPSTHDPMYGFMTSIPYLIKQIQNTKLIKGITLSGGDPLMQPAACIVLSDAAHELELDVWMYTGWTYEEITNGSVSDLAKEAIKHADVLVDGPFLISQRSEDCIWRGSTNQRLIDIKKSLLYKEVVIVEA